MVDSVSRACGLRARACRSIPSARRLGGRCPPYGICPIDSAWGRFLRAHENGGAGRQGPAPPERIVMRVGRDRYWISTMELSSP